MAKQDPAAEAATTNTTPAPVDPDALPYVVLRNPRGIMVEFNRGSPHYDEFLYSQRPPGVKPAEWFREPTPAELAAYVAARGKK